MKINGYFLFVIIEISFLVTKFSSIAILLHEINFFSQKLKIYYLVNISKKTHLMTLILTYDINVMFLSNIHKGLQVRHKFLIMYR